MVHEHISLCIQVVELCGWDGIFVEFCFPGCSRPWVTSQCSGIENVVGRDDGHALVRANGIDGILGPSCFVIIDVQDEKPMPAKISVPPLLLPVFEEVVLVCLAAVS